MEQLQHQLHQSTQTQQIATVERLQRLIISRWLIQWVHQHQRVYFQYLQLKIIVLENLKMLRLTPILERWVQQNVIIKL